MDMTLLLWGLVLILLVAVAVLVVLLLRANDAAEKKLLLWQQTRLEMIRKELMDSTQQQSQRQLESWRKELTESAQQQAQNQFESWRKAEMDNVRTTMRESVRNQLMLDFEQWKVEFEKTIRKDAAAKSQSTLVGKITEHFIPYLPDFSYNPQDARFLGSPVDFVIFDGLSEGTLRKIVFVEVKTNAGSLSTRERQIRDVVQNKLVEWIPLKRKVEMGDEENAKE